jgi:hypothetical protein
MQYKANMKIIFLEDKKRALDLQGQRKEVLKNEK